MLLRLLVLWTAAVAATAGGVPLHKCCPLGQYLQDDSVCKPDLYHEDWMPLLYGVGANGGIMSQSPEDVETTPAWRPVCPDGSLPVHLQSNPDNPMFVLLRRDDQLSLLMTHGQNERPFPPDDFCVDRHSALVCNAPSADGVRKCCGPEAVYSLEQVKIDFRFVNHCISLGKRRFGNLGVQIKIYICFRALFDVYWCFFFSNK